MCLPPHPSLEIRSPQFLASPAVFGVLALPPMLLRSKPATSVVLVNDTLPLPQQPHAPLLYGAGPSRSGSDLGLLLPPTARILPGHSFPFQMPAQGFAVVRVEPVLFGGFLVIFILRWATKPY